MAKLLVLVALVLCALCVSADYWPSKQGGPAYGEKAQRVSQGGPAYGGTTYYAVPEPHYHDPARPLKGTGHHGIYGGPDGFGVHVPPQIGQPSGAAYGTWGKGTWKH